MIGCTQFLSFGMILSHSRLKVKLQVLVSVKSNLNSQDELLESDLVDSVTGCMCLSVVPISTSFILSCMKNCVFTYSG